MSEPPFDANRSALTAWINLDLLEKGAYITPIPIHEDLTHLIGLVTVHWGQFEIRFDRILAALLDLANRQEPGWERRAFKQRKELFVRVVKTRISPHHPEAGELLLKVAGNAAGVTSVKRV
jgi:hypothetical protein